MEETDNKTNALLFLCVSRLVSILGQQRDLPHAKAHECLYILLFCPQLVYHNLCFQTSTTRYLLNAASRCPHLLLGNKPYDVWSKFKKIQTRTLVRNGGPWVANIYKTNGKRATMTGPGGARSRQSLKRKMFAKEMKSNGAHYLTHQGTRPGRLGRQAKRHTSYSPFSLSFSTMIGLSGPSLLPLLASLGALERFWYGPGLGVDVVSRLCCLCPCLGWNVDGSVQRAPLWIWSC